MAIDTDRGQTWILDAVLGVAVLLIGLSIAIFTAGITPQEVSQTETEAVDNDIKQSVDTALAASKKDGSLKRTVLGWDTNLKRYRCCGIDGLFNARWFVEHPNNEFGDRMRSIENKYDVNISVRIAPRSSASAPEGTPRAYYMMSNPEMDDPSQVVTESVTIMKSDELQSPQRQHNIRSTPIVAGKADRNRIGGGKKVGNAPSYPLPPGKEPIKSSRIYNIVDVLVIVS